VSDKFYKLQNEITEQSSSLQLDGKLKDDSLITNSYESKQFEIRQNINKIEKEYVDKKLNCYNFLSGTLKK
jgi:U3 small nucleolar ribonucleoprotein component